MDKEIILTGLRTNAEYHLGNYLGAIKPMVERSKNLAGEYQINLFAPDIHSFTTPIEHSALFHQTMHNLKVFVACGLPLNNTDIYIYRQSYIPAVSELMVILNNFVSFGVLSRMTQFKDKAWINSDNNSTKGSETTNFEGASNDGLIAAGLFTYPVLMAADILLFSAKWVPVGDDQTQHLEFTRDLAIRFNNKFGEIFVVPQPVSKQHDFVGKNQGTRIRSLRNPEVKMSKSIEDPAGTIKLSDKPDEAAKKIMGATTDSVGVINFDWQRQPGITNLLQILALLSDKPQKAINNEWVGKTSYGDLKKAVAAVVSFALENLQANMKNVSQQELQSKLEKSEHELQEVANTKLLQVQKAVGLRPA
ncbi:tryptophan--tRNA ligase [Candidatus Saccharibacteria bacterium]|mgnify:FL=1|jgi:tryptophanyl-tRNA synthetase|nr:tryptophan--tRNA ligase [Candidatus Saccharibacteria bacterium]